MVNTIIKNFESHFGRGSDLKGAEKNILKFNSAMKKLGFGQIYFGDGISDSTICEKLTLCIMPNFPGIDYQRRNTGRSSFAPLYDHAMGLTGSNGWSEYYSLRSNSILNQQDIKITFKGKKYEIGHYLPDRNIVIIYLSLYPSYFKEKRFEYLDFFIESIQKAVQENIKEQDTSDMAKKIILQKYMTSAKHALSQAHSYLSDTEDSITEALQNLTSNYNRIETYKQIIGNNEKLLENLEKGLLEQIEEIKKLSFVTEVGLDSQGIRVSIQKIFIKVQGKDIEMGEYDLYLMPDKIKIVNKQPVTYSNHTYHSCHIKDDRICFGSRKTFAYELLGQLKLKKLVHFLNLYLKSYNPEDTYLSMNHWIDGKENGGKAGDRVRSSDESPSPSTVEIAAAMSSAMSSISDTTSSGYAPRGRVRYPDDDEEDN